MNIGMVTRDRPRLLEQTIRSLYLHTSGVELTVLDDCSADRSMVEYLQREYGFRLILNLKPTPLGASKNQLVAGMPDGLVYLTDNDIYFTPGWLDRMLYAWENRPPTVKLLGGGCHAWLGGPRIEHKAGVEYRIKDALSGWSWLFERSTWEEFGPLDGNALGSGQSEDWAFCQRIREKYEVASIWPEVVIHCGKTNTEGQPAVGAETIGAVGVIVE